MLLPPQVFSADLTAAEFRTIVVLYQLSHGDVITATTDELAEMTGYSTETLRRAFRGLESKELLVTTRTKRNFGRFYFNTYRLLVPAVPHEAVGRSENAEEPAPLEPVGSTHGQLPKQSLATCTKLPTTASKTHYVRLTLARDARKVEGEEPTMVNRFTDDFEGGGVGGLLPDDVLAKEEPWRKKPVPNSRKTATEFADRLRKANPYTPGLVNVLKFSVILSKYRKEHSVPYEVERAVVDLWFEDPRNSASVESLTPEKLMAKFLAFYRSNLRSAYALAAIPWPGDEPSATVVSPVSAGTAIYASDGSPFPDSPGGRKHLAEYEDRLLRRATQ